MTVNWIWKLFRASQFSFGHAERHNTTPTTHRTFVRERQANRQIKGDLHCLTAHLWHYAAQEQNQQDGKRTSLTTKVQRDETGGKQTVRTRTNMVSTSSVNMCVSLFVAELSEQTLKTFHHWLCCQCHSWQSSVQMYLLQPLKFLIKPTRFPSENWISLKEPK